MLVKNRRKVFLKRLLTRSIAGFLIKLACCTIVCIGSNSRQKEEASARRRGRGASECGILASAHAQKKSFSSPIHSEVENESIQVVFI